MKKNIKKAYICPLIFETTFDEPVMQVPASLPQGNGDDPIIDDEGDELSKGRKDGWGELW